MTSSHHGPYGLGYTRATMAGTERREPVVCWVCLDRLKLKGIDGGPHKRWSMWFNSTQREEPYPGLKCEWQSVKADFRKDTRRGCLLYTSPSPRD